MTFQTGIHPVPQDWAKSAWIDNETYLKDYERLDQGTRGVLGRSGQAHRLDQGTGPDQGCRLRTRKRLDQMVRRRRAQRVVQLPRPASREARRPDGDPVGRRRPGRRQGGHLPRAPLASLQARQRPEIAGRQERRPRHDLHADDPGSRGRDARLRPDRRCSFGGLRRLLARFARRSHPRLRFELRHHRRRGPARRPQGAAQGQHRRGAQELPDNPELHRLQAHRRRYRLARRPRRLVARSGRRPIGGMRARAR